MKFNCPYCSKELNLMELTLDSDLYAIIKMQPVFGKHANLVWAYVELFGIRPMKGHTKKIRILLEEMKGLFESEAFSYQKKKYAISRSGIAEALNIVVHRHFTDRLESHNYLKKIMIGIAEREERESGRQAERDLRKREDRMRYPYREEQVEANSPSLNPSHRGRDGKKDSPPLMGGDEGEGEIKHLTPERIDENKRRMKALLGSLDKKT